MDKEMEKLKKIESLVRLHLFPTVYDIEDIAVKIYIELLERNLYLSRQFVKFRCIDVRRKAHDMKYFPIDELEGIEAPVVEEDSKKVDLKELINVLMRNANLTSNEKYLIYQAFYKEEKVPSFLLDKVLAKLKKVLTITLREGNKA